MTTSRVATIADFQQTWSDFHKEAYGFRPRGPLPEWTLAEWEAEFNRLHAICEQNRIEEEAAQTEAAKQVEALFAKLIKGGASDRATALRWLHDAHETGGDNEYLCYSLGLPYGYFNNAA